MKRISYWAYNHPWPARILISLGHCILICIGLVTGIILAESQVILPDYLMTLLIIAFIVLTLTYPSKTRIPFAIPYSYLATRMMNLAVLITGLCMVITFSNRLDSRIPVYAQQFSMIPAVIYQTPRKELRKERKELRKSVREYVLKAYKSVDKRPPLGIRILLTILIVTLAVAVSWGILALSCSIACSGAEGIAVIVFLGGMSLVAWLSIVALEKVWSKTQPDRGIANRT